MLGFRELGENLVNWVFRIMDAALVHVLGNLAPKIRWCTGRGARDLHDPLNIKQPLVSTDLRGAAVDDRSRDCRSL